jgi:hypothetical protein
MNGVQCSDRGQGTYYLWIEGKSTRGFDLTIEYGKIEIRNTIMSNRFDFQLTNQIISEIINRIGGEVKTDEGRKIKDFPIFTNEYIEKVELGDCLTIYSMIGQGNDLTLYGPNRTVHFGKTIHKRFIGLDQEMIKDKMMDLMLFVNYRIPDYEYGTIIQVGKEDDKKIMKILTNSDDCIIDKYDYILIHLEKSNPIMITNEILNSILPGQWELVDEYTIVAPKLPESEWNELIRISKEFDLYNKVMNKEVV